jgi:spermidine/putrescine transport system substrate-binding protein
MTTFTGKISRLALAAALSASVAAIALAEDKDLIIFEWSGYEVPEFHPGYIEKIGDSPTFTFFGDEEEAFQKIRAGFKADLSHPRRHCGRPGSGWVSGADRCRIWLPPSSRFDAP